MVPVVVDEDEEKTGRIAHSLVSVAPLVALQRGEQQSQQGPKEAVELFGPVRDDR
jgi:hypothetical protein